MEDTPAAVLLECAAPGESEAAHPYTRLFLDPIRICIASQPAELPHLFAEIEAAVAAGYYAAGYFTYECGAFFEPTAALRPSMPGQPVAWFGIYDRMHCFDHRAGVFLDGDPPGLSAFRTNLEIENPPTAPQIVSNLCVTGEQFALCIAAIHEWIRSGDVYQLNFTIPIRIHSSASSAALYQHLRTRQPAPYCAFLHTQQNHRILSFSPELFFRIDSATATRQITTKPMKGTAPRGRTTTEDTARADWLRNDPKNRSENVMIVDLLRNDLGRICAFGTVHASNLFAVERYPTLWQMTSTITGELRPDVDFQQIFRALFPCGSITGAPKVRAMQLLATLEDQPRGVYTGAIGFFSREKTVFSVAIRTLELDRNEGKMGVGSGIVIDSEAAGEFRECLLKAEFLTRSAQSISERFSLIETMLWSNGYPLLELHLDRLEDSARYFTFPCDRAAIKAALEAHANEFSPAASGSPHKVRLLLHSDGTFHITGELLRESLTAAQVRIARQRTDPADPMYFHKTTHRPLYAEALKAATQAGYDDVIFLNLQGEVTEGAIHNVFIEKDGILYTPPITCGLLPGVHRRHILETQLNIVEKALSLDDLRTADNVYLSNAVRGIRPALIDWEPTEPDAASILAARP
ncbi:MAG: aminodeoxychorismate synthase component I [Terracidiphilus sp.]|jgi:para-aminobenzoate synthetase/4-amino-4-deoxychorismate lyase